jgi:hypothetical protein
MLAARDAVFRHLPNAAALPSKFIAGEAARGAGIAVRT